MALSRPETIVNPEDLRSDRTVYCANFFPRGLVGSTRVFRDQDLESRRPTYGGGALRAFASLFLPWRCPYCPAPNFRPVTATLIQASKPQRAVILFQILLFILLFIYFSKGLENDGEM